jgi:hypothetical protein
MARSRFGKGEKVPAKLDAQLQRELDTETLKTTRRLSAPFPYSYMDILLYVYIYIHSSIQR